MQHLHMGPTDAVKVHHDIGCPRISIGIHWGTFMMSDEHYLEPAKQLKEAWKMIDIQRTGGELTLPSPSSSSSSSYVPDTQFITTSIGQTVCVD